MKKEKHLSLRIEEDLLKRFHFVAKYNGRSANGELLYLIRRDIVQYERENGKIKPEDLASMKKDSES